MHPLNDITIYYDGTIIDDNGESSDFRRTVNYICDFYHKMLNGYKPPRTSRICIQLGRDKKGSKPHYFGSICSIGNEIDEDRYMSLSKPDKYKYVLEILHQSTMELAEIYNWDKTVFQDAYDLIYRSDFRFSLSYTQKKSKDRKVMANVLIEKTEATTTLYLVFEIADTTKKIKLFENKNWFWWDIAYEMAKNSKWLNNHTFGVYSRRTDKCGYYSLLEDAVFGKLDIKEYEFVL